MTRICQIVVMGDSLSDRGTLDKRKLLGFIPMSLLAGLDGKSPKGRFTNGFLWGDYVCSAIIEGFGIEKQRKKLKLDHNASANADLSDEFLTNDALRQKNRNAFSLNNDLHVLYNNKRFARFYCEGGLTAFDYSDVFTADPTKEIPRLIMATIQDKRTDLLADDKKYRISRLEKNETLIIEWSGANDLITVNNEPTHEEADNAINERIKNIEQLIRNGYRNFVLFNLPNLALTPRYQSKSKDKHDNALECSEYFNTQLAAQCDELKEKYNTLHIPLNLSVFDVNSQFEKIYNNPEQYGFDRDKLKAPFTSSDEFEKNKENPEYEKDKISPSEGYMFWDDVHPTADMHNLLADAFKQQYHTMFSYSPRKQASLFYKEDYDILKKSAFFAEDKPKLPPRVALPEDIKKIMDELYLNAKGMSASKNTIRREKGELLKSLLFELKCQNGGLEELHGVISAFKMKKHNMRIIKTHQNPVFDFFVGKKTTHSEDMISHLEDLFINRIKNRDNRVNSIKI